MTYNVLVPPSEVSVNVATRTEAVDKLIKGGLSYGSAMQVVLVAEENLRHAIKLRPTVDGVSPVYVTCFRVRP